MGKRSIKAKEILADIRGGMEDSALMGKYRLTPKELEAAYRKLVSAGVIERAIGTGRNQSRATRNSSRRRVSFALPIYSEHEPEILGTVFNINENGIGVRGLEATPNKMKSVVIPANKFFNVGGLSLQVSCKWTARHPSDGETIAGFEIGQLSGNDSLEFRKLIRLMDIINDLESDEFDESARLLDRRRRARHSTPLQVPIHEVGRRENWGRILNMSNEGFAVEGMSCEQGDTVTMVIPSLRHRRRRVDPIMLISECRWVSQGEPGDRVCGFKIANLTVKTHERLQSLVQICAGGNISTSDPAD